MSSHGPGSLATQCPGLLCPPGVLPRGRTTSRVASEADCLLHRFYEPMRQTKTLLAPWIPPCARRSCRLLSAPAGRWPFPTLSLRPLRRCSDPYPATLLGCTCPLLHRRHGLTPRETGSTRGFTPTQQLRWGAVYRGCSHSITFGLLRSLDLQVAPTAAPKGTEPPGLSHHAEPGRLPDPGSGVASCPTRTTDTAGLSPAGSQPCRLLLPARGSTTRAIFAPKSSDSDNDSRLQRRPLRSPTGNARPTTRYYDVSRSRPPESSIWKQRTNSSAMRSRWL